MQEGTIPFQEILDTQSVTISFDERSEKRYPIGWIEASPCMRACPAGVNVKAYISLIAAGRFQEALEVVKQRNPFPGICGRVCTHPCESYCTRGQVDAPIAIRWLKRFVADYELRQPHRKPTPLAPTRKERIAIIGSGPAGLTAASDLIRKGYRVTVFEALNEPGGMMVVGIPSFRLPREIIRHEIDAIANLGVEIRTGEKIAGEDALDKLFAAGFDAIFIAVGAHKGKKLEIPGEEKYAGILDAITFLQNVNLGQTKKPGNRVAVIGGGNSAIDAARSAIRLGCEQVTILYRRSREEMPASDAEIEDAELEGVKIQYLAAPIEVLGERGKVTGLKCTRIKLGKPDASGRRRPIPVKGSEFVMEVDAVIAAISQEPDLSFLSETQNIKISKRHTVAADEDSLATSRPGVFAGGDAVSGPNTVIDAIAAGHVAARSIERYLTGKPLQEETKKKKPIEIEIKTDIRRHEKKQPAVMPLLPRAERSQSFAEVELGLSEIEALAEARRCLRCGPCNECFVCVSECDKTAVVLSSLDGQVDYVFRLPPDAAVDMRTTGLLHIPGQPSLPVKVTPTTCFVKEEICRGCGECVQVCRYGAPVLYPRANGVHLSLINPTLCKGCGACVAVCPSGAIAQNYFSSDWLERKLETLDANQKNAVVFTCNWYGAHVDAEILEHAEREDLNLIHIRTTCTGRIESGFIFRAFERGADGVLVVGCPRNACHYGFGNLHADERFGQVQSLLNLLGFPAQKFEWAWPDHGDLESFKEAVALFLRSIAEDRLCGKYT